MSYDEPEYDLLAAFKARFGISDNKPETSDEPPDPGVLSSAKHIYDNAVDVSLSMQGTKAAARSIYALMKSRSYSMQSWNSHPLHPTPSLGGSPEECVNFIFAMDLLNFSFWSPGEEKYVVEYKGDRWTGYHTLVAALRRALDEDIPITSSDFWQNREECTDEVFRHVFRSETNVEIPLLEERMNCLRKAGQILYEKYSCSPLNLLRRARSSARRLIHLLTTDFEPLFSDVAFFPQDSRDSQHRVRFLKRAQILAADLWACFHDPRTTENGQPDPENDSELLQEIRSLTNFDDIDQLTIFADYRIPQMLNHLGAIEYSPVLTGKIARGEMLESGGPWEVEIRGCAIWSTEMLRREILALQRQGYQPDPLEDGDAPQSNGESQQQEKEPTITAVLIDYFLYDLCKEMERSGELDPSNVLQHHRTRSIWY